LIQTQLLFILRAEETPTGTFAKEKTTMTTTKPICDRCGG